MPKIPTYTAGDGNGSGRGARYSGNDAQASAIATAGKEANQLIQTTASIFGKLQAQADESIALERLAIFIDRENLRQQNLFSVDPTNPDAPLPSLEDAEKQYQDDMRATIEDLQSDLTPGARQLLRSKIMPMAAKKMAETRGLIRQRHTIQEGEKLINLGSTFARLSLEANDNESYAYYRTEYQELLDRGVKRGFIKGEKKDELLTGFDQTVLFGRVNTQLQTSAGRLEFDEADSRSAYASLNPKVLGELRDKRRTLEEHAERVGRETYERQLKEAREAIETGIQGKILSGNYAGAEEDIKRYGGIGLLRANDMRELTASIRAQQTQPRPSDPSFAGMLLDAESVRPMVTEADIKAAMKAHNEGKPGINLADAQKAMNQLRSTAFRWQDKLTSDRMKEHEQAEQNLRAMLGIRPDKIMIATSLGDDPRTRLYRDMLPTLAQRSYAFPGGSEDPRKIVRDEFGPIIKATIENARFTPDEMKNLFPDWQSLERAHKDRRIDDKEFESEKVRRGAASPTQAKEEEKTKPKPSRETSGGKKEIKK